MTHLTLEQFRATGRDSADLERDGAVTGNDVPTAGRMYADGCFIETGAQSEWHLVIANCQWEGTQEAMEFFLYVFWYLPEHCEDEVTKLAARFAAELRQDLSAYEWAEMRRRNASPQYEGDVCASHDFRDSNMTMADAFEEVTGREASFGFETNPDGTACDPSEEAQNDIDTALWNAAWNIAKPAYLTAATATLPQYLKEFPDFDAHEDIAALLARGFQDISWHNDACPVLAYGPDGAETLYVFVDYADRSKGDYPDDDTHLRFGTIRPEIAGQIALGGDDINASYATYAELIAAITPHL